MLNRTHRIALCGASLRQDGMGQPAFTGVVEGFFSGTSPMWTLEARLLTLEFLRDYAPGINSYFYCPRDDLYVRSRWAESYPPQEAEELKIFVDALQKERLSFIYGLNFDLPGHTHKLWTKQLTAKLVQLRRLGCQRICLLFDDDSLLPDHAENQAGQTASKAFIDQALIACALLRKEGFDAWLRTPDTCFCHSSQLTLELRRLSALPLVWTGQEGLDRTALSKEFNSARSNLGGGCKDCLLEQLPGK